METKRDAIGVVDAINSEDIGKFPDTNLAESLQRITGISIDRRNGEGAQVTARGFGPQFNLITLNGRQIPGADAFAGGGNGDSGGFGPQGRSFNFANLSAEAVSAVEVYKTARADVSSGGIGATINIKTARPLDNDGMVLNLGAKGVYDESSPFESDVTPEVNGIFSYANESKTWGCRPQRQLPEASHRWRRIHGQRLGHPCVGSGRPLPGAFSPTTTIVERTGDGPALRHPERRALRVLGLRA